MNRRFDRNALRDKDERSAGEQRGIESSEPIFVVRFVAFEVLANPCPVLSKT